MKNLTIFEQSERIIKSHQNVLYLYYYPGFGKTAIPQSIAQKNGMVYFDYRASMRDSVDILGALMKEKITYKEAEKDVEQWVMDYAIPKVFYLANKQPTLIVFEELNRGTLETRNAMLQVFLERMVGTFALNENVYFCATGNMGEEDNCDVDDFDEALWQRLVPLKCELTYEEWFNNHAKEHVNIFITDFLKNNLEHFHVLAKKRNYSERFMEMTTNPRAWTKFSNFIGKDVKNIQKILDVVEHYGLRYLHPSTIACFTRYLQNLSKIKLDDILNRFDEIKPVLDQLNKSYLNEFCEKLKTKKLNNLNKKQLENLIKFLDYIPDDEKCAYLCYIVDEHVSEDTCEDILKKKVSKSEKKNILKGYGNNFNTVINHFSDLIDILERKSKQLEDKEEKETKKIEKKEDEKKS